MIEQQLLEITYQDYLDSKQDIELGKKLCKTLYQAGFKEESRVLNDYFNDGVKTNIWKDRHCSVGPKLPFEVEVGDIWFDTVELMPMLLVPHPETDSKNRQCWIASHPVYVWQFKTFLKLANWHAIKEYFMNVSDLMSLERFDKMNCMAYVTNLYHEEAVAYAHWFGKYLCGQFELEAARKFFNGEEFHQLLPSNLRLWDESECSLSEFVRIAVNKDTIDKISEEEFEQWEKIKGSKSNSLLVAEWERSDDISFSTTVPLQVGLIQEIPRMAYEFIEIQNSAFR